MNGGGLGFSCRGNMGGSNILSPYGILVPNKGLVRIMVPPKPFSSQSRSLSYYEALSCLWSLNIPDPKTLFKILRLL